MTQKMVVSKDQAGALLSAIEYYCNVFWGPDPSFCVALLRNDTFVWARTIRRLCRHNFGTLMDGTVSYIKTYNNELELFQDLEVAYVRIFINSNQGIIAPLYHSCYESQDNRVMGEPASMMKQRLASSGLALGEPYSTEPPDHLSIELEYLYYLLLGGLIDQDQSYRKEAASFSRNFMLPWVTDFAARLENERQCLFYPLSAGQLVEILHVISLIN